MRRRNGSGATPLVVRSFAGCGRDQGRLQTIDLMLRAGAIDGTATGLDALLGRIDTSSQRPHELAAYVADLAAQLAIRWTPEDHVTWHSASTALDAMTKFDSGEDERSLIRRAFDMLAGDDRDALRSDVQMRGRPDEPDVDVVTPSGPVDQEWVDTLVLSGQTLPLAITSDGLPALPAFDYAEGRILALHRSLPDYEATQQAWKAAWQPITLAVA